MVEETENLVLEQLRILRAEVAAHRQETREGFSALATRLDAVETEVRGANYIMTVSIGSVLADVGDIKARLKRLENA
jgi:hypothetical protein